MAVYLDYSGIKLSRKKFVNLTIKRVYKYLRRKKLLKQRLVIYDLSDLNTKVLCFILERLGCKTILTRKKEKGVCFSHDLEAFLSLVLRKLEEGKISELKRYYFPLSVIPQAEVLLFADVNGIKGEYKMETNELVKEICKTAPTIKFSFREGIEFLLRNI